MDESTGFRIGSTGKTMTAMAVAALLDSGSVRLHDRVDQHVVTYPVTSPDRSPIRLRHLASHTSGLGDLRRWGDVLLPKAGTGVRAGRKRPDLDELYRAGLRTALPPGIVWRYANHGIGLLGSVIEHAAGQDFCAATDRLVLKPLGMTDTGFGSEWLVDERTATGYTRRNGLRSPVSPMDVSVPPAGSAVSRASDMARYLHALVGAGGNAHGRVVSTEAFDAMLRPLHQPDPRQTQTAMIWWLNSLDGHRVLRHGGAWTGFRSCCLVAPDDGVALWLGVNGDEEEVEQVGLELLRALLEARPATDELTALAAAGAAPPPPSGRYTVLGTPLSTLTTWSSARGGLRVTQSADGAVLSGDGPWRRGFPLLPISDDSSTPLLGAATSGADPLNHGFTTVQVLGTPLQPLLLVNGRTPYVRTTRRHRPWTPLDELAPATRDQLEQLCIEVQP